MAEIAVEADFPAAAELFAEYEAGETPEAQLASDLDKLDMYVQSLDYEQNSRIRTWKNFAVLPPPESKRH